ncbi:VOC family protein [Nocardioides panzhihuensis]|uniref:Catechol 2,3-dioxygenase-like lactoylglutathione lyase family enzyme n=1 Tax=Nocardioides panzhihuensis TaxID=860243 RepID=A0A7Z0IS13_9ACTN|nr:VOC family protein [Nocardioides panzhihuensis]NYI77569.1 catechol 2,3-dioxygenase-like lactoylglutathione lyase family enzyme [Nocardioides panzhihuensis]
MIIEAADFDEAVHFYRDVLGMPEQPAFATGGDDRVSILHAGLATIEIATSEHIRSIDQIEDAPHDPSSKLRIALEVDDTEAAVRVAQGAGMELISGPVKTPFRSLNARIQGPAKWQVTLFQELESLEQRTQHEGFSTDSER